MLLSCRCICLPRVYRRPGTSNTSKCLQGCSCMAGAALLGTGMLPAAGSPLRKELAGPALKGSAAGLCMVQLIHSTKVLIQRQRRLVQLPHLEVSKLLLPNSTTWTYSLRPAQFSNGLLLSAANLCTPSVAHLPPQTWSAAPYTVQPFISPQHGPHPGLGKLFLPELHIMCLLLCVQAVEQSPLAVGTLAVRQRCQLVGVRHVILMGLCRAKRTNCGGAGGAQVLCTGPFGCLQTYQSALQRQGISGGIPSYTADGQGTAVCMSQAAPARL